VNAQLALLAASGMYVLLGIAVVAIRWRYGILRAMGESIASQYGVPPERVRMAFPIYVAIWPFFVRGIFSDRARIARIRRAWNETAQRCDCGGTFAIDDAQVRRAMHQGEVTAVCGLCSCTRTSEMNIRIDWKDE